MISVDEALTRLLSLVGPVGDTVVPLAEAGGRVLSRPIVASRSQPPFAASAMDGYAIAGEATTSFTVVGESAAGSRFSGALGPSDAVRIFTGAPVPDTADRIVIQEDADRAGDRLTVREMPTKGAHIRPAGGDFAQGSTIKAPRRLTPADIALAAAMGQAELSVSRRPVVALIATGDELVAAGEAPGPDQIVASNSYGLKALFEAAGARTRLLPIARDTVEDLKAVFDLASGADLIVTTGGASVGDHDLVGPVARDLGMEQAFYKVRMRPGKPLMAGRLGPSAMIGLPGNPVSSMVCGHIFVLPMIDAMLGLPAGPRPRDSAPLARDIGANGPREHYQRAWLDPATGAVEVGTRQDSSLLTVLAGANVLVVRPPEDPARAAGESVEIVRL